METGFSEDVSEATTNILPSETDETGALLSVYISTPHFSNTVIHEMTPDAEELIEPLEISLVSVIDGPSVQSNDSVLETWKDSIRNKYEAYLKQLPKFDSNWTPLHIASYTCHHDAARLLLTTGISPNSKDVIGQTPLDIAGALCYIDPTRINRQEYVQTIKTLIEFGGELDVSDTTPSNSALHTAVELGSVEAIQELLAAGAPVWKQNARGNTPLHECVVKRYEQPLQVLANYGRSIDVVNSSGQTALHVAIMTSWAPGVHIALKSGADVTVQAHDGNTAIHIAALQGNLDILKQILCKATFYRNAVNFEGNNKRVEPPIFCAIRSGNIECVKAFLDVGVYLNMSYFVEQISGYTITPVSQWDSNSIQDSLPNMILHATAKVGSVDMLELILKHDKNLEHLICYKCPYLGNMTPIEFAAFHSRFDSVNFLLKKTLERTLYLKETFDHAQSLQIARNKEKLLEKVTSQNSNATQSAKRKYSLHDAAKNNNRDLIEQLIHNGADLSEADEDGITAISLIINHIAKPTEFIAKILDNYIIMNKTDAEYEITVDYRVLIPTTDDELENNNQMRVVTALLKTKDRQNQRKLLAHPLIESFLYLKMKTVTAYFYLMMSFYFLFVMSLSARIGSFFYYKDKFNKTMIEQGKIPRVWDLDIWKYIIALTLCFVVIQELPCLNLRLKTWSIKTLSLEFWMKFVTYSLAIATTFIISFELEISTGKTDWPRNLSTLTLVLAWLTMMMMIAKTPISGIYIEMFWIVLIKVIKIFATFSVLILMFSLCFMIQFHSQTPFEGPWAAIAKTLVMMTSEFDYGNTFTREKAEHLSNSIQLLRVVFVIFLIVTAIVLMNLMIGVAVHDVQNLFQDGHLKKLEKQVAFLDRLEDSRRSNNMAKFLGIYRRITSNVVPQKETFKPVNNHKCRFSSSIKEVIVNKVQQRLDKIEREVESNKLETKMERLINDVRIKLESMNEQFYQNLSNKLDLKLDNLSRDMWNTLKMYENSSQNRSNNPEI